MYVLEEEGSLKKGEGKTDNSMQEGRGIHGIYLMKNSVSVAEFRWKPKEVMEEGRRHEH